MATTDRLTDAQVEALRDLDRQGGGGNLILFNPSTEAALVRRGLIARGDGAVVYLTDAGRAALEATADWETTPEGKARRLFERHLRSFEEEAGRTGCTCPGDCGCREHASRRAAWGPDALTGVTVICGCVAHVAH